ncbi:methyltransferase domain-containing protein [Desulfovibrionales bacterium]
MERPADLESLWQAMDDTNPEAEHHIPYWVELWPATLALCSWIERQKHVLPAARCLDLGCGLGLSALVAARFGATVLGMDLEPDALRFARRNAQRNGLSHVLWACMDWNHPALASQAFAYIWGGDIFYEQQFFEPLETLLLRCLALDGRVWFGDPERSVSREVWARFTRRGWNVRAADHLLVPFEGSRMAVNIWELRRK